MFTGIVEEVGKVARATDHAKGRRLSITAENVDRLPLGASIAVNGVCLTAVSTDHGEVTVDVIPESLARTNLGQLAAGDAVNLERPMPADGRFDGHIVQGHVDGTGTVASITEEDGGVTVMIDTPDDLLAYLVEKGSVTVDGVSLTVAGLSESSFGVALIPHTLEATTLGLRKVGDVVNLEVDVLAKYVERLLKATK